MDPAALHLTLSVSHVFLQTLNGAAAFLSWGKVAPVGFTLWIIEVYTEVACTRYLWFGSWTQWRKKFKGSNQIFAGQSLYPPRLQQWSSRLSSSHCRLLSDFSARFSSLSKPLRSSFACLLLAVLTLWRPKNGIRDSPEKLTAINTIDLYLCVLFVNILGCSAYTFMFAHAVYRWAGGRNAQWPEAPGSADLRGGLQDLKKEGHGQQVSPLILLRTVTSLFYCFILAEPVSSLLGTPSLH